MLKNINLICALSLNNCIGKEGKLPWGNTYKKDLELFKDNTVNNITVMGYNTFKYGLNSTPLKDRVNIVLSKRNKIEKQKKLHLAHSIQEVFNICELYNKNIFIIGGKTIYDLFLPHIDYFFISHILSFYNGDCFYYPPYEKLDLIFYEHYGDFIFSKYKNVYK